MKRRIFTAVPISPGLQNKILAWEKNWHKLPVGWLNGKNLHITLTPPFYTDNIENIKSQLKKVSGKFKPFAVKFEKVSYGPDLRFPRLIWAEGKTPPTIIALKSELEKVLRRKSESRPFLLHLTIARFRPKDYFSFPVKKLDETIDWQELISSFVLMESHLSCKGADYEILETIPL